MRPRIFLLFLILFMFITFASAQSLKPSWRWDKDPILRDPDASALHLIGSAYLAGSFDAEMKWWEADLLTLLIGVGWEVKDAFVRYEDFGIIGGQGFGINDVKCDAAGILLHRLGVLFYNRIRHGKWSLKRK